MTFHALFFDLDGTLADTEAPLNAAIDAAFTLVATYHPRLDPSRFRSTFEATLRTTVEAALRGVSERDALRLRFETALQRLGFPDNVLARRLARAYLTTRSASLELLPDALEALPVLSARTRLGLIVNGPAEPRRGQVRDLGIERFLEWVVISGEEGVAKPAPEIYQRAAQRAEIPIGQTAYVAAAPNDVYGAGVAGMAGIWLNRAGRPWPPDLERPAAVITSLRDLPSLV